MSSLIEFNGTIEARYQYYYWSLHFTRAWTSLRRWCGMTWLASRKGSGVPNVLGDSAATVSGSPEDAVTCSSPSSLRLCSPCCWASRSPASRFRWVDNPPPRLRPFLLISTAIDLASFPHVSLNTASGIRHASSRCGGIDPRSKHEWLERINHF